MWILDQCLHCVLTPVGFRGSLVYPFTHFCVLLSDGTLGPAALERSGGSSWQAEATVGPGDGYFRRQHGVTLSPDWALAMCSTPRWLCPHGYVLWKEPRCTECPFFWIIAVVHCKSNKHSEKLFLPDLTSENQLPLVYTRLNNNFVMNEAS